MARQDRGETGRGQHVDISLLDAAASLLIYHAQRYLTTGQVRRRTRDEWITMLHDAGVPCGSVRDIGEAMDDPQLDARGMIAAVEHASAGTMRVLGVPIKLSDTPGTVRTAPPLLGQHTEHVLEHDLGLDVGQIAHLRAARVI